MAQIDSIEYSISLSDDYKNAGIDIRAVLKGTDLKNKYLWARIENRKNEEEDAIFPLPLESRLDFSMMVKNPVLWNAENAAYYKLILEIHDEDGTPIDHLQKLIGFYRWSIINYEVCLNGKTIQYRTRSMPGLKTENAINQCLRQFKREYINSVYLTPDQKSDYLSQKALEYGFYLIVSGEHLDGGRICGELDRNPKGFHSAENPNFSIQVVKNGALIENRSDFINTTMYQLQFSVQKEGKVIQKGLLHADIPAGESRYLNIPFLQPHDAGRYVYRIALCLESGSGWEDEGYEIASGETTVTNFYAI